MDKILLAYCAQLEPRAEHCICYVTAILAEIGGGIGGGIGSEGRRVVGL